MTRGEADPVRDAEPVAWLAMDAIAVLAEEVAGIGQDFFSQQERARLAAVSGPKDRAAFMAGRLLMRRLLARVHGGDPQTDWPLTAAADDAPAFVGQAFVRQPAAPWQMSIGHGGAFVACAVSGGRVAIELQVADAEQASPGLGEVSISTDELHALRDMDGDQRVDYLRALRALHEAAVKCEAARSTPAALRRLAQGGMTPSQWAGVLPELHDAAHRERTHGSGAPSVAATGWTRQGDGLTLAVVATGTGAPPRWALPPPPFALQTPVAWRLHLAPDPLA